MRGRLMRSASGPRRPGSRGREASRSDSRRLFHQDGFAPAIISAMRAGLMGQLGFVAMRALRELGPRKMIVRPAAVAPRLGMSSFWVRHLFSDSFRRPPGSGGALYSSRAANGESPRPFGQLQEVRFRSAPQTGHKPRQSGRQITFIGMDRITCSVTRSASAIPSPE